MDATADLALDNRIGWPPDLRLLADRYPRQVWTGHANLGQMARFWLQRHDMFRDVGAALTQASAAFREGTATPQDFRAWFPPRLQFFLEQLHAHHQVEDLHFFPVFQAAEARLARGFDVLEADHRVIHGAIEGAVTTANAFIAAPAEADALHRAADGYAAAGDALLAKLTRHLHDEEDLIIPLILDRGEAALGVG
jgi:iron-sulfur cluster repair protein YtfE (RIC family)